MSIKKPHPECGQDEVFITNADSDSWPKIGWLTKRKGIVAYDTAGKPLGSRWHGAFPVFAKKDEIRKRDPKILERLEAR
jgi:hypothetical protein